MENTYNKLNELFVKNRTGTDVISGLLMAQAMAHRMLLEKHSKEILELMGNISKAIEKIQKESVEEQQVTTPLT